MPDIESELHFLADIPRYKEEKPYNVILAAETPLPTDSELPLSNIEPEARPVFIKDFRDHVQDMTVREHGFQLIHHTTKAGFDRTLETIATYRAETEAMLREAFDADFILCWDYKARTNDREELPPGAWNFDDMREREGVSIMPHSDHTKKSGPLVVKNTLPVDLHEKYLDGTYELMLVNTWRPILPVIEDQPLAVCDARSVEIDDLVPCDRVVVDRLGEIYLLRYNKQQSWYWVEHQKQDEVLVFVTWASEADGRARTCFHASFSNSRAPPDAVPRQSVETRSLVIRKKARDELR